MPGQHGSTAAGRIEWTWVVGEGDEMMAVPAPVDAPEGMGPGGVVPQKSKKQKADEAAAKEAAGVAPLAWWQKEAVDLTRLGPGSCIGEDGLLDVSDDPHETDDSPRYNASVRTATRSLLLCVRRKHLIKLVRDMTDPSTKRKMASWLEANHRDSTLWRKEDMNYLAAFAEEDLKLLLDPPVRRDPR